MRYEFEILDKDEENGLGPGEGKKKVKSRQDIRNETGRSALLLLRDIGIAIGVIILALQFVKPMIVFEHSMEDTLYSEDYVFLSRQAYTNNEIQYGDIVVFESRIMDDRGSFKNLIKRVIGLPGDTITIKDEAVYRNGSRLYEPYTKEGVTLGEMSPVTIPDGKVFVMGDNRQVSTDSRSVIVGLVDQSTIQGKVFFRLLPVSRVGRIN